MNGRPGNCGKRVGFDERYGPSAEALRRHGARLAASRGYAAVFGGGPPSAPAAPAAGAVAIAAPADATQRRAVRAIVGGSSFALRGPPGTGKSSTIATACVALVARSRRVLVVGQEDAAARVVASKVRAVVDDPDLVAGPAELSSTKGPPGPVQGRAALLRRFVDRGKLPPSAFSAGWLDAPRDFSVDGWLDDAAVVLGRPKGRGRERRFVCELCGKDTATEAPMVKHLARHASDLAAAEKRGQRADLRARAARVAAWRDGAEAAPDAADAARSASAARLEEARAALDAADAALEAALDGLAAVEEALDAGPTPPRSLAVRALAASPAAADYDGFAAEVAAGRAEAAKLYALLAVVADERIGNAATLAALDAPGLGGLGAGGSAVAAAARADPSRAARVARDAVFAADLLASAGTLGAFASGGGGRARAAAAAAAERRIASAALASAAAADAAVGAILDGAPPRPLVVCATPALAARHGLLVDGAFDVVVVDEASQLPLDATALALAAAGTTAFVVAGDDMQLPPRRSARGLLDEALDGGVPLVPLEWHYRSARPSLIACSNALFYEGRLLAPCAAPGGPGGLSVVRVAGPMESARGPPAGLVNAEQAARVAADAAARVEKADAAGTTLSLGVITLNRPQRAAIRARLLAGPARLEPHPTAPGSLRRAAGGGRDLAVLARDPPLFVESIDRIQGEERDTILFSTLLAPRGDGLAVELDQLEEAPDASSSDDDDGGDKAGGRRGAARRRRPAARGARHYSTLSHAHGHRLLNVGLSRAVREMVCYAHPRCPAPPPHDDRPGRRAFGWLARLLLDLPSPCACAACAATDASLKRTARERFTAADDDGGDSDDDDAAAAAAAAAPPFARLARRRLRALAPPGGRVAAVGGGGSGAVDAACRGADGAEAAVLLGRSPYAGGRAAALDACDAFPAALLQPKLGWARVEALGHAAILGALADAPSTAAAVAAVDATLRAFADRVFAAPPPPPPPAATDRGDGDAWLRDLVAAPPPPDADAAAAPPPASRAKGEPAPAAAPVAAAPPVSAAASPVAAAAARRSRVEAKPRPASPSPPAPPPSPVASPPAPAPRRPLSCRNVPRRAAATPKARARAADDEADVSTDDDERGSLEDFIDDDDDDDASAPSDDDDSENSENSDAPPPRARAGTRRRPPPASPVVAAPPPPPPRSERPEVASDDESAGSLEGFVVEDGDDGDDDGDAAPGAASDDEEAVPSSPESGAASEGDDDELVPSSPESGGEAEAAAPDDDDAAEAPRPTATPKPRRRIAFDEADY